ncbi:MAG TPA: hypothetical protein PLQ03_11025 [Brevundimonas sp.]|uniref:hypothetical protein n=1 Tax=Brevundimonas sp. TaxID=1871086 RepID=UPI00261A7469|nr:hypothetical protein [Brevundimonas sp.]HRO33933.1 hypothetical protein [Brevundimonas sp.]
MNNDWQKGYRQAGTPFENPMAYGMEKLGQDFATLPQMTGPGDGGGIENGGYGLTLALCVLGALVSVPLLAFAVYSVKDLLVLIGPVVVFWLVASLVLAVATLAPVMILRRMGFGPKGRLGRTFRTNALAWLLATPLYPAVFMLLVIPRVIENPELTLLTLGWADWTLPVLAPFVIATAILRTNFASRRWLAGAITTGSILALYAFAASAAAQVQA